jgi:hypothetical protein
MREKKKKRMCKLLTYIFHDLSQLRKANISISIFIELAECLEQLILSSLILKRAFHELDELVKLDGAAVIFIDLLQDKLKILFGWFESQVTHDRAQLCSCDSAIVI